MNREAAGDRDALEAGDILYNPPFYWHYVRNPTASIGVGVRFYDVPRILGASTTQGLLTLMASNPPVWVGRRLRFDFATAADCDEGVACLSRATRYGAADTTTSFCDCDNR